jgi:hypothetical protein
MIARIFQQSQCRGHAHRFQFLNFQTTVVPSDENMGQVEKIFLLNEHLLNYYDAVVGRILFKGSNQSYLITHRGFAQE